MKPRDNHLATNYGPFRRTIGAGGGGVPKKETLTGATEGIRKHVSLENSGLSLSYITEECIWKKQIKYSVDHMHY